MHKDSCYQLYKHMQALRSPTQKCVMVVMLMMAIILTFTIHMMITLKTTGVMMKILMLVAW